MSSAAEVAQVVFVMCLICHVTDAFDGRGGRLHVNGTSSWRQNQSTDDNWEAFKTRYRKTYSCVEEEEQRRNLRTSNLDMIRTHNQEAAGGKYNFTLRENNLIDLTPEEYRKMLGYRSPRVAWSSWRRDNSSTSRWRPRNSQRQTRSVKVPRAAMYYQTVDINTLPLCVNWTERGWVGPVKNQGHCGSCWSHSAAGSLQSQYYNYSGSFVQLSEQNLLDCTTAQGNQGCDGGNMQNAFWYVQTHGIESLSTYPETSSTTGVSNPTCKFDAFRSVTSLINWMNVEYEDELALQQAVALVGPVSAALDTNSVEFQTYGGGIYWSSTCGNTVNDIDHAVLIVGYGVFNGQPYWLIQNTWGTGWGINGYMLLARNAGNMCGIATDATFPIVGLSSSPIAMNFRYRSPCPSPGSTTSSATRLLGGSTMLSAVLFLAADAAVVWLAVTILIGRRSFTSFQ